MMTDEQRLNRILSGFSWTSNKDFPVEGFLLNEIREIRQEAYNDGICKGAALVVQHVNTWKAPNVTSAEGEKK